MGFCGSINFGGLNMQIINAIQPTEFPVSFERPTEKAEKPAVKIQNETPKKESPNDSEKLQELKSVLDENNISLSFSQDEETKALVVKLVDKITGEAIIQIPTEVSLKLTAVNAKLQGNFLDQKS
jgi:uncharacterized FlaG/YvyC family protein